jgi:hypothetical protein
MRTTIHTVSAREYWLYAAGIRQASRDWAVRVHKPGEAEMKRRNARLRRALAGGPKSVKELGDLAQGFVGLWGELVRVPPSGTWERRRADLLATADYWLGPCAVSERDGLEHLIRRYFGGFGPGSLKDVSAWSGVPVKQLEPVAAPMRLRRFRSENGGELLDLPRAPLPPADTPAPVRFLPWWDAVLLVHARRTGVMPEEYRPIVFATKNPPSVPTFLVDGRVAGAWRHANGKIELEPYEKLPRAVERELRAEAKPLAAFMNGGG